MRTIVLILMVFATLCSAQTHSTATDSLVNAERAFARKSRETNTREAFLANFASDGIVFTPGPTNAVEFYSKRPAPPSPAPFTLDWEPAYVDVSRSGELGFTTGPYTRTDNAKHQVVDHGNFFTVWKRGKDGSWKVVLDAGVPTTSEVTVRPIRLVTGSPGNFKPREKAVDPALQKLLSIDAGLSVASYVTRLDRTAFVVKNGLEPMVDDADRREHLQNIAAVQSWKPLAGGISKSADLAYVYGSYQATVAGSNTHEIGTAYYARVWKRDDNGDWKIVLDNTKPLGTPSSN